MSAGSIDRAIDALLGGEMDFVQFRRILELQIGRNPGRRVPTRERLDGLKEAGRMSESLHRILVDELDRSAFGEITVAAETAEEEEEARVLEVGGAPVDALPVEPVEPTEPDERPPRAAAEPTPEEVSPPRLPEEGELLGDRYVLESVLGRGGMSLVFRARDLHMPDSDSETPFVALKVLTPEFAARPDARAALGREASYARRLNHPGLVRVYDADVGGPLPFVVMELLEGERLRSLLVRRYPNPLPEAEALPIIRALAEVLVHLHRAGVVHRDVKPANVFIAPRGELRLLDLGVAGPTAEAPGEAGALRARTPVYASPGVLAGAPPSPADDVYALGCVAYEVLAGRHPFGKLPGNEAAAKGLVPARLESLPASRWQALKRSLEFDAARRQPTAAEFLSEFFAEAPPPRPARPWVAGGVLAGLVVGLVLGWFAPPPQGLLSRLAPTAGTEPPREGASAAGQDAQALAGEAPGDPAQVPPDAAESGDGVAPAEVERTEEAGATTEQAGTSPEEAPAAGRAVTEPDTPPAETVPDSAQPPRELPEEAPDEPAGEAPADGPASAPVVARAPAPLALPGAVARIQEGASALRVVLNRPAGYEGPLRVEWRTVDGTARDGDDFAGGDWQELEAAPGSNAIVLYVPIVSDARAEPAESFFLEIRRARGGPPVGETDRLQIVIQDDDPGQPAG